MPTNDTFALYEYTDTDIAKATAAASLNLNDGTSYTLGIMYDPQPAKHDWQTDQYPDVTESIPITAKSGTASARRESVVTLEAWARKCQLYNLAGRQGNEIWLKYQPSGSTSAAWSRIRQLGISTLDTSNIINLEVTRSGLWEGAFQAINCAGASAAAASTITLSNHLDPTSGSPHANYVYVSSTDIKGDAPGVLQVMAQSKTSAANLMRIAKRSIGTFASTNFVISETAGSGTASSDCSSGCYIAHATPAATYTDGSCQLTLGTWNYGTWRVFERISAATSAATAMFRLRAKYNTSNTVIFTGDDVAAPISGSWCMVDLGLVTIQPPYSHPPSSVTLYSQYKRTAACPEIDEDYLMALPVDEFYHVVDDATANSTSYKAVLNGVDDSVSVAAGASNAAIYQSLPPMGQPLTLEPGRDNYFFFLCDRSNDSNNIADALDVTLKYIPRFRAVRGST